MPNVRSRLVHSFIFIFSPPKCLNLLQKTVYLSSAYVKSNIKFHGDVIDSVLLLLFKLSETSLRTIFQDEFSGESMVDLCYLYKFYDDFDIEFSWRT